MANKYRVNSAGATNWNDVNKWDDADGGAGGDAVPGAGDNVIFNGNSGLNAASIVTLNSAPFFTDFTCTQTVRVLLQSSTLGTAVVMTGTGTLTMDNIDFMDVTAAGASSWNLSAQITGDCQGNTGITFTTGAIQTYTGGGTNVWSEAARWTSRVPLPQDNVSCPATVTIDVPRIGKSIIFNGTPTVSVSNIISNYGSFTMVPGMTYTIGSNANHFRGRGSYTLTTAGKTIGRFYLYAPSGTLTQQDDMAVTSEITPVYGTWDTNGYNVYGSYFFNNQPNVTINLNSSIITLTATSAIAYKWNIHANATLNAGTSTIIMTNSGTNAQSFLGGGNTYNHVRVEGAGAYTLTITGDNTFEKLRNDSSVAVKTILLTPTSTQTIRNLQVFSSAANVAVFNTGGAAATIHGHRGYCELNHVSLTAIVAGEKYKYYAGNNSTDGTGNTNWIFTHKARYVD